MVGVAQLVEHLTVAQAVVGSNPIAHPIYKKAGHFSRLFYVIQEFPLIPLPTAPCYGIIPA